MIESVRKIADAVLYEGFLLFPYSKDALKNAMPFQFGVVMPRGYADRTEPSEFRSELLLRTADRRAARLCGMLRFLQVGEPAVEREVPFECALAGDRFDQRFSFGELRGSVALTASPHDDTLTIAVEVRNESQIDGSANRAAALQRALISAHLVLETQGAAFASLLDPPEELGNAARACNNERWFPVLAGDGAPHARTSSTVLVSPIVLYDFPRVAEASAGPTFDGTEIDELLTLSVAALTDEERAAARAAHPSVAAMVERAEALRIAPGWRVRVHPKGRADVWDSIVDGKTARVVDVKTDVDGKRYVGVLFDDDPASEMHEWYGRSFYYGLDELEALP